MHTISVNGVTVRFRGRVEFGGGVLSVPNNRESARLAKLLASSVEHQPSHNVVIFDGQQLPSDSLILYRAPKKVVTEG